MSLAWICSDMTFTTRPFISVYFVSVNTIKSLFGKMINKWMYFVKIAIIITRIKLLKIVFWNATPQSLLDFYGRFDGKCSLYAQVSKVIGSTFLRKICKVLALCTVPHPKSWPFSQSPLGNPKFHLCLLFQFAVLWVQYIQDNLENVGVGHRIKR